jgi:hypothetical protein
MPFNFTLLKVPLFNYVMCIMLYGSMDNISHFIPSLRFQSKIIVYSVYLKLRGVQCSVIARSGLLQNAQHHEIQEIEHYFTVLTYIFALALHIFTMFMQKCQLFSGIKKECVKLIKIV